MEESKAYTLITGASRGIGKAFALEAASRNRNLALVSLPNEGLADLAREIEKSHGVKVAFLETDLAKQDSVEEVYEWTREFQLSIDMLINNAGFGQLGLFHTQELGFYRAMLRLNMEVPLGLTHKFLPQMQSAREAYIINVGSAAGFFPVPHKSVYSASKSFLYFISRAVQRELRNSSVHISVVCPNGVPTNDATRARVKQLGWKGKLTTVSAEGVAKAAFDGAMKKKKVVIPGRFNQFSVFLTRLLGANYAMRFMEKQFQKELPTVESSTPEEKGKEVAKPARKGNPVS